MTTRTAPTLLAFFSAAVMTVAMLAGVDGLATSQPTAAQVAHAAPIVPKG